MSCLRIELMRFVIAGRICSSRIEVAFSFNKEEEEEEGGERKKERLLRRMLSAVLASLRAPKGK